MNKFEAIIGLEVHAELQTRSKMFCGCAMVDTTTAEPNTSVCEVCTGMPGTLPVINEKAVEYALRVALALHCTIAETSVFARKNYFYPDLPKGFQISQYEFPLAHHGWLAIDTKSPTKRVGIRRVHIEEDTGKLFHRSGFSLVDFNRSGVPLLEIVSEPDLRSVEEVKSYATSLRSLLRYLGVNSGDMQKGLIRFEANVSVRPRGSDQLGTRSEIKNLNSFRAMTHAISYEIQRQSRLLDRGEKVAQETLGWDEHRAVTVLQRSKEEAHDYRYFPEPDLPPLVIGPEWIETVRSSLPELPEVKRARFLSNYALTPYISALLTIDPEVADYFEEAVSASSSLPEKVAHWLTGELFALSNQAAIEVNQSKVSPQYLAAIVDMVEKGEINTASGKEVLATVFKTGRSPIDIINQGGYARLADAAAIQSLIHQILNDHPKQVSLYLEGKEGLSNWFFGQVMRLTGSRADPQIVRRGLLVALRELKERDDRHRT